MMELVRSIGENLDLAKAFHLDKEEKHLKRWFEGEIIEHKTIRAIEDKFLKEGGLKFIKEKTYHLMICQPIYTELCLNTLTVRTVPS